MVALPTALTDLNDDAADAGVPAFVPALAVTFIGLMGVGISLSVVHNFVVGLPVALVTTGLMVAAFVVFNALHLLFLRAR